MMDTLLFELGFELLLLFQARLNLCCVTCGFIAVWPCA
jgi:hypothetical protein